MNLRFAIVEKMLQRAQSRWKWARVLYRTFLVGSVLCLLALLFNLAVHRRVITGRPEAIAICLMIVGAGLIAWFVLMITALAGKADRGWLAAKLEGKERRFLDRLNTLLFLENRRADLKAGAFAIKIAQQTKQTFGSAQPQSPFSMKWAGIVFATFAVLLVLTLGVYQRYSPWRHLTVATRNTPAATQDARNLELAPPATNNIEQNKNWGEVRITDPACDLKVTKVDVVPLQIEAAANEALSRVSWFSTINGAQETPHDLPPPSEQRYAAYQPTLYLDELQLSDWDLMTYYAKANTEKDNSFASEVYFLEVRPFREDILKMPGGEGGKAYKVLNEMTALINRQQHVIRQTHQHIQKPAPQENLQAQDRKKLSDAETDLGDSSSHLYAEMAAEMENAPIAVALDNLAKAAHSLDDASDLLKDNSMKEAPGRERDALTELVAARKMFQKAVCDNPDAFGESGDPDEAPIKLAIDETKKLEKMAEFRNEAKAGRDFIQKAMDEQRRIEQGARSHTNRPGGAKNDLQGLAARERRLEQSLQDFQQQHPQLFKDSGPELDRTRQSMQKAVDEMQNRSPNSQTAAAQATKDLQNLGNAMNGGSATQQLADAYRLKQMLDNQIRKLDDFSSAPSNNIPNIDPKQTARDARATVNQLKAAAEQEPTRDAFGQPLRDSLSGTNKVDIDSKLAQLEQSQDQPSQQQRAGDARDALSRVSKAFGDSEPKSLQMARKSDSLKPDEKDSFNLGLSQLDSLAKQLGKEQQKLSAQDQAKQGQEALYNLQTGLRSLNGDNERGNQIMLHLEELVKSKDPIEVEDLRKLLSELQHFSVESSDHFAKRDDPEVTNIDPAKLPPAYRGRIQKYFQKLSEK